MLLPSNHTVNCRSYTDRVFRIDKLESNIKIYEDIRSYTSSESRWSGALCS